MSKNFIFYNGNVISSIPKVACTTVKSAFLRDMGYKFDDVEKIHELGNKKLTGSNFKEVKRTKGVKIFLKRNPYDRIFSGGYNKTYCSDKFPKKGIPKYMEFLEFLEFLSRKKFEKMNNHFKPQTWFCDDLEIFDYVLDISDNKTGEIMSDVFDVVFEQENKSKHKTIVHHRDDTIKRINKIYRNDFRILGYTNGI